MSQARATFQSRFTVITDTPSTSATSSSCKPAKKRISNDAGGARVGAFESGKGLVENEDVVVLGDRIPTVDGRQAQLLLGASSFFGEARAGVVN